MALLQPYIPYSTYKDKAADIVQLLKQRAEGPGFDFQQRQKFFFSPQRPDRILGSPSLLSNRDRQLFPGLKPPESEADHTPPAIVVFKSIHIYGCLPPRHINAFVTCCSSKLAISPEGITSGRMLQLHWLSPFLADLFFRSYVLACFKL